MFAGRRKERVDEEENLCRKFRMLSAVRNFFIRFVQLENCARAVRMMNGPMIFYDRLSVLLCTVVASLSSPLSPPSFSIRLIEMAGMFLVTFNL